MNQNGFLNYPGSVLFKDIGFVSPKKYIKSPFKTFRESPSQKVEDIPMFDIEDIPVYTRPLNSYHLSCHGEIRQNEYSNLTRFPNLTIMTFTQESTPSTSAREFLFDYYVSLHGYAFINTLIDLYRIYGPQHMAIWRPYKTTAVELADPDTPFREEILNVLNQIGYGNLNVFFPRQPILNYTLNIQCSYETEKVNFCSDDIDQHWIDVTCDTPNSFAINSDCEFTIPMGLYRITSDNQFYFFEDIQQKSTVNSLLLQGTDLNTIVNTFVPVETQFLSINVCKIDYRKDVTLSEDPDRGIFEDFKNLNLRFGKKKK